MNFLDFFAIVERDLEILNPISHDKLMLLGDYCGLGEGVSVLDIGSGKGCCGSGRRAGGFMGRGSS